MGIGCNIKKYRLKLGMDQKTLAVKLGITSGAVSNYENDLSFPREDILYKIVKLLEVTPNELFDGCFSGINTPHTLEGTEERKQINETLENELRILLIKHGLIASNEELTADQSDFLLHLAALIKIYFKK